MAKLGKLRLLSDLRKLLAQSDTQIIERRQKICGQSTWDYDLDLKKVSAIKIILDPRRDGRVRLVIHELLHMYMDLHYGIDSLSYEIEEAAVVAWEDVLYGYLHDSKRAHLLESWNKAIGRKM